MTKIRQPPAKIITVLLLIIGLAVGTWYSYGIATGSMVTYPQPGLILEIIMLLTFVWMLIWTLKRRAHKAHDNHF